MPSLCFPERLDHRGRPTPENKNETGNCGDPVATCTRHEQQRNRIRAANLLQEARRIPGSAGAVTVTPDWSPVAERIRDSATDDWNDHVAVDRFVGKGGHFVRCSTNSRPYRRRLLDQSRSGLSQGTTRQPHRAGCRRHRCRNRPGNEPIRHPRHGRRSSRPRPPA